MAATPRLKVHDASGVYQASCKEGEAAACLVALYGPGSTIRHADIPGPRGIVWREGSEECEASESYDTVALTILDRVRAAYGR